jgi:hypothetical protein
MISHACGSSKAFSDLVEELLGSGVLALSQPPMRFMMQYYVRAENKERATMLENVKAVEKENLRLRRR